MRCETIQKAMSSLPSDRLKRRPKPSSSSAKMARPQTTATAHGTPSAATATIARITHRTKHRMAPTRGR